MEKLINIFLKNIVEEFQYFPWSIWFTLHTDFEALNLVYYF